jgi:hypothetical protein
MKILVSLLFPWSGARQRVSGKRLIVIIAAWVSVSAGAGLDVAGRDVRSSISSAPSGPTGEQFLTGNRATG